MHETQCKKSSTEMGFHGTLLVCMKPKHFPNDKAHSNSFSLTSQTLKCLSVLQATHHKSLDACIVKLSRIQNRTFSSRWLTKNALAREKPNKPIFLPLRWYRVFFCRGEGCRAHDDFCSVHRAHSRSYKRPPIIESEPFFKTEQRDTRYYYV